MPFFCIKKLRLRHFCRKCRENLSIRVLRTKFWVKSACEDHPQVVPACFRLKFFAGYLGWKFVYAGYLGLKFFYAGYLGLNFFCWVFVVEKLCWVFGVEKCYAGNLGLKFIYSLPSKKFQLQLPSINAQWVGIWGWKNLCWVFGVEQERINYQGLSIQLTPHECRHTFSLCC